MGGHISIGSGKMGHIGGSNLGWGGGGVPNTNSNISINSSSDSNGFRIFVGMVRD
jgi:hypothetical protein